MEEIKLQPGAGDNAPATTKQYGGFYPGHPRYGGRKKGSTNKRTRAACEMAKEMGVDPVQFMLSLLLADSMQVAEINRVTGTVVLDEKGKPKTVWQAVTPDMRLEAAKAVAPYVHPKLMSTQVTGKDDGPIAIASLDMSALLQDPEALEAAQKLALMMAKPDVEAAVAQITDGSEQEDE